MKVGNILLAIVFGATALGLTIWLSKYRPVPADPNSAMENLPGHETMVSPTGPQPHLVVEETEYNFGIMELGSEGSHDFVIRNDGEGPLVMKVDKTTCRCTIGEIEGDSLPPGESTTVTLKWKVNVAATEFQQSATIQTNDPDKEYFSLVVFGTVAEVVSIYPKSSWVLGSVTGDEPFMKAGVVGSPILEEFNVVKLSTESGDFEFEDPVPFSRSDMELYGAKCGYTINVKPTKRIPLGEFVELLIIETDARDGLKLEAYLKGQRSGPIQLLGPDVSSRAMAVRMGDFPASEGKTISATMYVRDLPEEGFEFKQVSAEPPELKLSIEPKAKLSDRGESYTITFVVPPGLAPMTRTTEDPGTINVETNHPDMKEIVFRVEFTSR